MNIIVGQYNSFTYALNTSAKTLTVSGIVGYDLSLQSIPRIYDTTTGDTLYITATTVFSKTLNTDDAYDYTWTFGSLPAGMGNSDTLVVYISVSVAFAKYTVHRFLANAPSLDPNLQIGTITPMQVGDANQLLSYTSLSSGAVAYTSSNTAVATIVVVGASSYLHAVGGGSTTVTASQVADGNYTAATSPTTGTVLTIFVPAVPNLWASYDMSLPAGVTITSGNVTSVLDNSGNSRNLTKKYTLYPTYNSSPFGSISITNTTKKGIYQDGFNLSGVITIYTVLRQNGFVEDGSLIGIGQVWNAIRQETTGTFPCIRTVRFANGNYFTRNPYRLGEWHLLSVTMNAGSSFFRMDTQYTVPMTVGANDTVTDTIALGFTGYEAYFDIAQLHIVNGVVSDANNQIIVNTMMSRFNIIENDWIMFFGDSITEGGGPTPLDTIWSVYCQLTAYELDKNIYNQAISGAKVFNGASPHTGIDLVDVYVRAKTVAPTGWLCFMYGTNDAITGLTGNPVTDAPFLADWKAHYITVLQDLITYGYNPDKMIVCTTNYEPLNMPAQEFVAVIQDICTQLGLRFYDCWNYTLLNGGPGFCASNNHPDTAGHRVMANGLEIVLEA